MSSHPIEGFVLELTGSEKVKRYAMLNTAEKSLVLSRRGAQEAERIDLLDNSSKRSVRLIETEKNNRFELVSLTSEGDENIRSFEVRSSKLALEWTSAIGGVLAKSPSTSSTMTTKTSPPLSTTTKEFNTSNRVVLVSAAPPSSSPSSSSSSLLAPSVDMAHLQLALEKSLQDMHNAVCGAAAASMVSNHAYRNEKHIVISDEDERSEMCGRAKKLPAIETPSSATVDTMTASSDMSDQGFYCDNKLVRLLLQKEEDIKKLQKTNARLRRVHRETRLKERGEIRKQIVRLKEMHSRRNDQMEAKTSHLQKSLDIALEKVGAHERKIEAYESLVASLRTQVSEATASARRAEEALRSVASNKTIATTVNESKRSTSCEEGNAHEEGVSSLLLFQSSISVLAVDESDDDAEKDEEAAYAALDAEIDEIIRNSPVRLLPPTMSPVEEGHTSEAVSTRKEMMGKEERTVPAKRTTSTTQRKQKKKTTFARGRSTLALRSNIATGSRYRAPAKTGADENRKGLGRSRRTKIKTKAISTHRGKKKTKKKIFENSKKLAPSHSEPRFKSPPLSRVR